MSAHSRNLVLISIALAICSLAGCEPGTGDGAGADAEAGGLPEEVVRHNIIGTSLLSQQKWDEAREQFEAGLEIRPDDATLMVNAAVTLIQQAREEEAESYLRRALESDPENLYAHYDLGLIEKNKANLEEAASHLRAVVDGDREEVAARYNLASILGRLERFDEAETLYREALDRYPTHISSLYGLGRLLIQTGREDEGVAMVARSQKIRAESGIDTAMGNQYGEAGPYAMGVDYPGGGLAAPDPIEMSFREATEEETGAARAAAVAEWLVAEAEHLNLRKSATRHDGEPFDVVALAFGDVNGDGALEGVNLVRSPANGQWSILLVKVDDRNQVEVVSKQPIRIPREGGWDHGHLVLLDRDHDGDIDLFGCVGDASATTCVLVDNDGSGKFTVADATGVDLPPTPEGPIRLAFSDFDNDRDIDLIAAEPGGVHVFSNLRDGSFDDVSTGIGLGPALAGAQSLEVADLNKDDFMDFVVGTPRGPVLALNERGKFRLDEKLLAAEGGAADGPPARAVVLDFDNDGFLDVAAFKSDGLSVFRNEGLDRWTDATASVFPDASVAAGRTPVAALDLDADGDVDLSTRSKDRAHTLLNDGANANHWIAIRPEGVNDNKLAIGTKLEVLAGVLRQKFEVQRPVSLHAGLGRREGADAVRLLWPGGVLQDEIDLPAGAGTDIAQLDRKGTSCPLLYAWRDGKWEFVTDFLGGCAIGYRHSREKLSVPDTDEYILVEGGLDDDDGTLRLRLNNQLEEVIWFDQAELIVVDHPDGTEVFPNERLMPGPPWPEFALFASSDLRPLASAREIERGRDVTARLRERDRRYVDGFRLLPFEGYAEMHTLELDLGDLPSRRRIALLLDGWIDYADSSANIAASQAGAALVPPRLHAADGKGGWIEIQGRMGFPAGLPKTMAVDLTGVLAPRDARVRISTTMRIYWDRARVMVGGEDTPVRVQRLGARDAELRFGGFPAETSPDGNPPFGYDPDRVARTSPWKAHAGAYTGFGPVATLLSEIDDRFVTTMRGDEIELRFDAPAPAPEGWTRTYLLFADGFGKDMDPNSAAGSRVGPIPFHGMPVYPYGPGASPPTAADGEGRPRIVLTPDDGLPGAVPLALQVERGRRE
jgi:Tfp pilus assembly protein PilF